MIVVVLCSFAGDVLAQPAKVLIAFASYRDRPKYPGIYFYEHNGVDQGKISGTIPVSGMRSESRPSLSLDGRWCAFAAEDENQTSRISLWDLQEKKPAVLPTLNDSPNAQLHPTLAGDGKTLVFAAWNRPNSSQRWDLFACDVTTGQTTAVQDVNTLSFDERMPALSGDGQWLAFVTNSKATLGLSDVFLCHRQSGELLTLPKLNSQHSEITPSLSRDGRLIAFASDRPGGSGGRDIWLFDRQVESLLPLPGLNSSGNEQSPSLSPDGRFVAFVSERIRGEGERDVFLYDRQMQRLLPTPGLNAKSEDLDPCVIVLP